LLALLEVIYLLASSEAFSISFNGKISGSNGAFDVMLFRLEVIIEYNLIGFCLYLIRIERIAEFFNGDLGLLDRVACFSF
jgi:hypothetical protein